MARNKKTPPAPPPPVFPKPVFVPMPDPVDGLTEEMLRAANLMVPRAHYSTQIDWNYLPSHLQSELEVGLDLSPDFQRGHRWSDAQRVAYLEHVLTGGEVGRTIIVGQTLLNGKDIIERPDGTCYLPDYCIVDGKQRLETILRFIRDEIRVFAGIGPRPEGYRWSECTRSVRRSLIANITWQRAIFANRAEMVRLYLKFNRGGTPHTDDEIQNAQAILAREEAKLAQKGTAP